jgi:hypothetical protein
MQQYDLSSICKNASLNFALSFENSLTFLSEISVIKIHDDGSVSRLFGIDDNKDVKGDHALCIFITRKLISYLSKEKLLNEVFNSKIVKFDVHRDTFSININSIPLEYPMIKHYLINMGIGQPEENSRGRILITTVYKHFFQTEILKKVITKDHTTSIDHYGDDMIEANIRQKVLFISYSHADEKFKVELVKHLSGMRRMGLISEWNDRQIYPGKEWDKEIRDKMEKADIILFLISSDFMSSDYINDIEIGKAIDRHNLELVSIVPIIVRPCDFASLPISKFQALPKNAKPISRWDDQDEALLDVVNSLKKIIR